MSGAQVRKGKRGEKDAMLLLAERDFRLVKPQPWGGRGRTGPDYHATDKLGVEWCIEVKHCATIPVVTARAQARACARGRRRWMVLAHIDGTREWLVLRQGMDSVVWKQRGKEEEA